MIRLTEKVEVKTNEELEDQVFKMRAKLFKFVKESNEWKERGTGDVRLLKHKENGKTRLVMRRDKTLKVCANHYSMLKRVLILFPGANIVIVVPDMKLSPNVGSDRSWVWNAAADVSEGEPEAQTLAIRFANSESKSTCIVFNTATTDSYMQTQTSSRKLSSRHSRRTRLCSRRLAKRLTHPRSLPPPLPSRRFEHSTQPVVTKVMNRLPPFARNIPSLRLVPPVMRTPSKRAFLSHSSYCALTTGRRS